MYSIQRNIVESLAYYAIFQYPLTGQELLERSQSKVISLDKIKEALAILLDKKVIQQKDEFYTLAAHDLTNWAIARKKGNEQAQKMLPKAFKISKLIGNFPFVRGVMLSGSISKNYLEADDDIDYFIVTTPHRLWLARAMLTLYKKVVLLGSRKYFCLNYFVDTEHLEVLNQNRYIATEVVTLIPTYGKKVYEKLQKANKWTAEFYPNYPLNDLSSTKTTHITGFKWLLETCFSGKWANRLDNFCMKIFQRHWKKRYPQHKQENFQVKKHISTHHPLDFQTKVMKKYEQSMQVLETQLASENKA